MIRVRPAARSLPLEQSLLAAFPLVCRFVESAYARIRYRCRERAWYLKVTVT